MTKKHLLAGVLSLSLVMMIALPLIANGQIDQINDQLNNTVSGTGLNKSDLIQVINAVIKIILSLLGVIAVIIILWGGFQWMTSGGNEESIGAAKKRIGAGVAGLIIVFLAYAIASFVLEKLANVTA